jgi:fructoselysine 6-kinase
MAASSGRNVRIHARAVSKASAMIGVYGDNCLDIYREPAASFVGGNAVNVAVHLANLGAPVAYFGVVGDDEGGAVIRSAIAARKVDCTWLESRRGDSGATWIELRDGERIVREDRVGIQCPQQLSADALQALGRCSLVHASAFTAWTIGWRQACPRLVEELGALHVRGVHLSIDFSELPEPDLAEVTGRLLRVGFISAGERATGDEVRNTTYFLHGCGIPEVVVTLGSAGAFYSGPAGEFHVPGRPIRPVDTLGAGDAFVAAWLYHRYRGEDVHSSMRAATQLAAEVCGYFGAWPQPVPMEERQYACTTNIWTGEAGTC